MRSSRLVDDDRVEVSNKTMLLMALLDFLRSASRTSTSSRKQTIGFELVGAVVDEETMYFRIVFCSVAKKSTSTLF